jgi:hypothetical protein
MVLSVNEKRVFPVFGVLNIQKIILEISPFVKGKKEDLADLYSCSSSLQRRRVE